MVNNLGIIILAGGQSRRMGQDKSLLIFKDKPLISYVVDKIRAAGFREIIIVTNDLTKYSFLSDVKIVEDYYPDLGPLAGIHAGLLHSQYENNFVIPCDMPFFPLELIKRLIAIQGDCKVVVPKMQEKYQPLAALYHTDCVEHIEFLLSKKEGKIIKLYERVKTCYLPMIDDDRSFFNINTPEDLAQARSIVKGDFLDEV